MPNDPVADAIASAKTTLANANKFTQNVVGNSTNAFAPPKEKAPKVPQAHEPADHTKASYGLAREARSTGEGIAERMRSEQEARKDLEPK
jgi:hypothetical protein